MPSLISLTYGLKLHSLITNGPHGILENTDSGPKLDFKWLTRTIDGLKALENMARNNYPPNVASEWHTKWSIPKDTALIEWYETEEDSWRGIKSTVSEFMNVMSGKE